MGSTPTRASCRRRGLSSAAAGLLLVFSLAWSASAQAAPSSSVADGATLGSGVSSVTWALGILDPHVDLGTVHGSGGAAGGRGRTLTVSATQHPIRSGSDGKAPKQSAGHVVAPPSDGKLPPASAGTNGTKVAHNTGQLELASRGAFDFGSQSGGGPMTTLVGGIAIPPASAPPAIQAAVDAANSISTTPYIWGGGHASFNDRGYDCSGAVSFALHGAGFLSSPLASGQLMHWGVPGPGKWLTVYASASHAYAVIAGLRWDTVGDEQGTGPRWHPEGPYPTGFSVRHFPGY